MELAKKWQARGHQLANEKEQQNMTGEDFICTLTELTAISIAKAYASWSPGKIGQVIVSGGGCRNTFLMQRLELQLESQLGYKVDLHTHETLGINSDAKEASLFALLGWLCVHSRNGNVLSCTGAVEGAVLGKITPGKNFASLLKLIAT